MGQLALHSVFVNTETEKSRALALQWNTFLLENKFDFKCVRQIDMADDCPVVIDFAGNKFSIDFNENKRNYAKKKASLKSELLSKALGAGRYGLRVLDLSAGLGIDAVFLAQLGYSVTAVERNPLIFLALAYALEQKKDLDLKVEFGDSLDFLKKSGEFDVVYFDPMFPEKIKSALPRQEMVFFKKLVGADEDAEAVLQSALKKKALKRVVVKRPLKAPVLGASVPQSSLKGKLVRFDIYGVKA